MITEKEFHTKAGLLSGVIGEQLYQDGVLRSCMFNKENKISFRGEIYIPKYENEDFRSRYRDAAAFYKSGELKFLYLNGQQEINTPVGKIKAEFVSFYKSGSFLRIFPVYGQIGGYWSEREEAELLPVYAIETGGQNIKAKFSCIAFYESGAVKSLTLWPGESIDIAAPAGKVKVRLGISFYENGALESIEPDHPAIIKDQNCTFYSYDNHPIGIHGDRNSLGFYENGSLKTLKTTITAVILSGENKEIRIAPEIKRSLTDIDKMEVYPIEIGLDKERIRITDSNGIVQEYEQKKYSVRTEQLMKNLILSQECGDCSSCSQCGHSDN